MSLTSYRAAPPRANIGFPSKSYFDGVPLGEPLIGHASCGLDQGSKTKKPPLGRPAAAFEIVNGFRFDAASKAWRRPTLPLLKQ
jgi:hypothetical protein